MNTFVTRNGEGVVLHIEDEEQAPFQMRLPSYWTAIEFCCDEKLPIPELL
jgi:hypothetical protein